MKNLVLYPKIPVKGQSFAGVKRVVVPMQSLSLKEIIRRFVKQESLPISKEGVYDDRFDYDLEKLAHEDLTVQHEVIEEMKQKAAEFDAKIKIQETQKKDAMSKAAQQKRDKLYEEFKQRTTLNPQTANDPKA